MPRFDQCIITTNDDHLQPLVFLTGPVNVGLFVDRSQELLLPPGSYRIQAYANAPTNLADNRIADLAISDAFTLRPGWRVDLNFRIIQSNGAAEGLSEVQGVPATSPPIATALPKSIQYEIERIRNGPHAAMPLAEAAPSALDGQTSMTLENGTSCTLSLFFSGPASQRMQLAPGGSQTVYLSPGNYELAARVSCPNVIPFYGTQTLAANTRYSENFYISGR
jgi:hypothetical protein